MRVVDENKLTELLLTERSFIIFFKNNKQVKEFFNYWQSGDKWKNKYDIPHYTLLEKILEKKFLRVGFRKADGFVKEYYLDYESNCISQSCFLYSFNEISRKNKEVEKRGYTVRELEEMFKKGLAPISLEKGELNK